MRKHEKTWENSQTRQAPALLVLALWILAMLWEFGERWRRCFRVVGIFALEDAVLTDLAESSRPAISVVWDMHEFSEVHSIHFTIYFEDMILQRGTSSSGMNWSYELNTLRLCAALCLKVCQDQWNFMKFPCISMPWTFFVHLNVWMRASF